MTQGRFVWYEVMTDAPEAARAFYEGVIGWTIAPQAEEPNGIDYRHIRRADGADQGGMMVLSADMIAHGARPGWFPYLMVDDVPATIAAITQDGGYALMPPTTIAEGTFALIADPWGAVFYLMAPRMPPERKGPPAPVCALDIEQAVAWNELISNDLDGARTFYARHFHFAFPHSMPMGPLGDYWFIEHPSQGAVGAMMQQPARDIGSLWRIYFRVDELARASQAVTALGGTLEGEMHEVPGGDMIIHARDPAGAFFGLVARKP